MPAGRESDGDEALRGLGQGLVAFTQHRGNRLVDLRGVDGRDVKTSEGGREIDWNPDALQGDGEYMRGGWLVALEPGRVGRLTAVDATDAREEGAAGSLHGCAHLLARCVVDDDDALSGEIGAEHGIPKDQVEVGGWLEE